MADYNCTIRTNYFHVKDGSAFEKFMKRVYGINKINIFKKDDMYAFGCYGNIDGYIEDINNEEEVLDAYSNFIEGLQKHICDNDAIIIMEVGNEKLNYVAVNVSVITSKKIKCKNIMDLALDTSRELLKNKDYTTQLDY